MLARKIKMSVKGGFATLILVCLIVTPISAGAQTKLSPKQFPNQTEYYKSTDFIKSVFYERCDPKTYTSVTSYKINMEYQNQDLKMESKKPCSGSVQIIEDKEEVYDCSYKQYKIESDVIDVEYTFYCLADCIVLKFKGKRFVFNTIDGGCDVHIRGLKHKFNYKYGTETMKIKVTEDIVLWEDNKLSKPSLVLKKGSEFKFVTQDAN